MHWLEAHSELRNSRIGIFYLQLWCNTQGLLESPHETASSVTARRGYEKIAKNMKSSLNHKTTL